MLATVEVQCAWAVMYFEGHSNQLAMKVSVVM